MRKLGAALLCAVLSAVVPRASRQAHAEPGPPVDDTTRARELFKEGSTLAEAGDWEGARDRFDRSMKLKRAALTLYNLGIADDETGHVLDAIESFRAFLAQPIEPTTQRYVDPVKATLAKLEARLVRIAVEVHTPEVTSVFVFIDGRDVTSVPRPWTVDPGTHQISVVAPGFSEARQTTTLGDGGRLRLTLSLEPRPTVASAPRPSVAVPLALAGVGGALFVGGGVTFGLGAQEGFSRHPDTAGTRAMVIGGVVGGVGLGVGGAGLATLVFARRSRALTVQPSAGTLRSARRPDVTLTPWFSGSAGGVRVGF